MAKEQFPAFFWGIVRLRSKTPLMLYPRGRDAQRACNGYNYKNKDPIYRVKRYRMIFKGTVVDVYDHLRETHHIAAQPHTEAIKPPVKITKAEWNRIRVGTIMVSPIGTLRRVVAGGRGHGVVFDKIGYSRFIGNTTTYVRTDLHRKYRIKKY